jgi:hypothetical protein
MAGGGSRLGWGQFGMVEWARLATRPSSIRGMVTVFEG